MSIRSMRLKRMLLNLLLHCFMAGSMGADPKSFYKAWLVESVNADGNAARIEPSVAFIATNARSEENWSPTMGCGPVSKLA